MLQYSKIVLDFGTIFYNGLFWLILNSFLKHILASQWGINCKNIAKILIKKDSTWGKLLIVSTNACFIWSGIKALFIIEPNDMKTAPWVAPSKTFWYFWNAVFIEGLFFFKDSLLSLQRFSEILSQSDAPTERVRFTYG